MLSIQEIHLMLKTLKKLKGHDFDKFIDEYTKILDDLAREVDLYNSQQIDQLDKPKDWYLKDLNWNHERRASVYDPLLDKLIESKIFQFGKMGKSSGMYNSLEIGPGFGRYSRMFLAWRLNFYVDLLPMCESKIKKLFNPKQHKYIKFYTTEKTECPHIPTNSCAFVFSWDTFPFFTQKHIKQYLKDIFRVVLPGGYCLIHYADCHYEKDLHEAQRGYWNFNTKDIMAEIIETTGYKIIEMDQFRPGANYCIFQKPGNLNPVLYKTIIPPSDGLRHGNEKRYGSKKN